jgi:sphinganine-1-phosphate aldolase
MAAAWAVMQHLGVDGYRSLTATTLTAAAQMRAGIRAIDGLHILGDSQFHLLAMAADAQANRQMPMFALGDALARRGWFHGRQYPPDSLHATVSAGTAAMMDHYLEDLAAAVHEGEWQRRFRHRRRLRNPRVTTGNYNGSNHKIDGSPPL